MRRLWPLTLALFCWLLVLLVPATRQGVLQAWKVNQQVETETFVPVEVAPWQRLMFPQEVAVVLKRYPRNRDVMIYGARKGQASGIRNLEILGELYPRDAYVVALRLEEEVRKLVSSRNQGPLTNPAYPRPSGRKFLRESGREEWQKAIDLARQGQALQPNNSFFDWMLLYALYGTRQDDEARRVLSRAVKKTEYSAFDREAILNSVAFKHLELGSPLLPRELLAAQNENFSQAAEQIRQVTRWAMETAIADRKAGRHRRAIDTAFQLSGLSRIILRGGFSSMDSRMALESESAALQSLDAPIKNGVFVVRPLWFNSSVTQFQSHPLSLYSYAKVQGRRDLLPILNARWGSRVKWYTAISKSTGFPGFLYSMEDVAVLSIGERLRMLILRALPSVVLLGIVFWLLSRRFGEGEAGASAAGLPLAWGRGMGVGFLLLVVAMGLDFVQATALGTSSRFGDWRYDYLMNGLLQRAPNWVDYGLAGAMFCVAISVAVGWQRRQSGEIGGLKQGLRETFHGADDGLSGFDFGWLFGWVVRLTFWLIFLGALVGMAMNREAAYAELYGWVPPVAVLISLVLHVFRWRRGTHRRQTARLSVRLIAEAMGGFFVVASVLYAVSAFVLLPKAWQFDRDFEAAIGQGELKLMRAKAGL